MRVHARAFVRSDGTGCSHSDPKPLKPVYELYNGSVKAFRARFSTTITTPGVLVVIWELTTRSERSKRSCEPLHSHLAATAAEGLKEWFHDHTPLMRPTDELKTITHIA